MNHISDPLEMPKVVQDQQTDGTGKRYVKRPLGLYRERWADRLWPCMAWFIFVFNVFVSLSFCYRIIMVTEGVNGMTSSAEYVIIVVTMCGTYMALMWAHHNILRKRDGLE